MNIKTEQCGAITVVKPEGPLTNTEASDFEPMVRELIKVHRGRVVLDMAKVPYMDSRGLGALVDITNQLAQLGQRLRLCSVNETLQQVIHVTGLSPLFEQFKDANTAVRSFL